MSKAREIRRRIRSVENTRQITRTMEMVATSKLKRATDRVYESRPYGAALEELVRGLSGVEATDRFPLLRSPEETRSAAILLLTANRGLAGAFNVNLIRRARELLAGFRARGVPTELHVAGRKGIAFFRFQGEPMSSSWTDIGDHPAVGDADRLTRDLRARFERGALDEIWVVSSRFRSALSTPPVARELLPIRVREGGGSAGDAFILSPSADAILNRLLPLYVRNVVYRALVENQAAEQGARRTAMKNATDSASDMLETLERTYNRARQGQITQEIAEIVGGADAFG
ncbi:MAG: ATP synthase F1 subunit gamma [Gammaproteobacteria bacterium]|nr:ATP synthase F1 subunit gamma [Gammaproteobacteria bacterium]MDE0246992.1 ATP synthase F1 subunit gamma [Gammaproteobacteria bacterium]